MNILRFQKGVGLMEVLVAMVILSIGILGFVALQARATAATTEALKRSEALLVLQGLAERMRLNSQGNYLASAANKDCVTKVCSANDQAQDDLYFFNKEATTKNMKVSTIECPQTSTEQKRICLLAAWDKTEPTKGAMPTDTTQNIPCLVADGSKYQDGATCMLMEVY